MTNKYYAWHWLNVEPGDDVYYYSHGKIYKQKMLHAKMYYETIEYSTGRKETYMKYIVFEVVGKSNRKTKFRYDVSTSELESGYGRDHNGNLRFSCLEAVKEYFEEKKKYAEALILYYNYLAEKNNKIIEKINNLLNI